MLMKCLISNAMVSDRIYEIIYGDNNTGLITREIIKGVLMCHSSKAHKWVGDILLAARLQEGLRQTIVECIDEGSKESFLYILKLYLIMILSGSLLWSGHLMSGRDFAYQTRSSSQITLTAA